MMVLQFAVFFMALVFCGTLQAQQTYTPASENQIMATREINITSDSAPGWIPSKMLERQVVDATNRYFASLDSGQYQSAYEMMAPSTQQEMPYPKFVEQSREFRDLAGTVVRRWMLKITWTKDPAGVPFLGVYAAVDVAGKFENVDRECGFLVFYQKPNGGEFQLIRIERNYIDNATARHIEQTRSRDALEQQWQTLSANCPNYASMSAE